MGTSEYRKVFVCTSCGGVYADEPVTQCDCMPEKQDFREMLIVPRETLAAIQHESDCVDAAKERIAELEARADALANAIGSLIDDIFWLTTESGGVFGLHKNGDNAPWDELLPGGQYVHLSSISTAQEEFAAYFASKKGGA